MSASHAVLQARNADDRNHEAVEDEAPPKRRTPWLLIVITAAVIVTVLVALGNNQLQPINQDDYDG